VASGKLRPYAEQPSVHTHPGAGPRHLAFHPQLNILYVVNELDLSVTVFAKDPVRGTLKEIQNVSGMPEGFTGRGGAADIHVHPTGRFVYSSIRSRLNYNSIAGYAVDEGSGKLTPLGHTPTGRTPRNFAVDPTGSFLVVAHQLSDDIHVFRIEESGGKLALTGHSVEVPNPTCIRFLHQYAAAG
jgi:6-phosphogluconolactonase